MALAIDIMVNSECNLQCPFCYGPDPEDRSQLDLTDYAILCSFLRQEGIEGAVLSGGEPTLRQDLPELVNLISRFGLWVGLQSNGTRPHALRPILHCLHWLGLPLDAVSDPVARLVRTQSNHEGRTWRLAMSPAVLDARAAGMKLKLGTVLTRLNIAELPAIAATVASIAPDAWKVHQFRPRGAGRQNRDALEISDVEFDEAVGAVMLAFPDLRMSPSRSSESVRAYLILNPDGELLVPGYDNYSAFGTLIRRGKLREEVWRSAAAWLDSHAHLTNLQAAFPGEVSTVGVPDSPLKRLDPEIAPREVLDRNGA